ncbi:ribulose bisphosphate carboxylase small subunit [Pollutimonas nitritireducens]|uniref:Ribulose bisphosphate carboxylase small subunit n=1 Tax=Pollutimonas nitritireducens TaxID=2045209 RepID=A0A2N4UFV0_9BURK|nr:ribulose bisphosphate carboxylase small subunit [Pollutimonas nitritireducens]PLC53898.1 ribulose bisphosphate carboxylase small subunit [Pollutimonas nitritireducens]
MRITQGTFSFLPDLTNVQISSQIQYCLDNGWAVGIEYTDDPHPRNTYWEMFGMPMFDIRDAVAIMQEIENARQTFPGHYIRVTAFDSTHTVESVVISFMVNRPSVEASFRMVRQEADGRRIRYSIEPGSLTCQTPSTPH